MRTLEKEEWNNNLESYTSKNYVSSSYYLPLFPLINGISCSDYSVKFLGS